MHVYRIPNLTATSGRFCSGPATATTATTLSPGQRVCHPLHEPAPGNTLIGKRIGSLTAPLKMTTWRSST
eukprot:2129565-Pleurochrysis_carterae.AAC.1